MIHCRHVVGFRKGEPGMFSSGTVRSSFCLSLLSCASLLVAQSERGTITGSIRDSSGAVIPRAKVVITNTATNVVVNLTTNDTGEYTAPSVAAGTYNITVQKEGFRPAE